MSYLRMSLQSRTNVQKQQRDFVNKEHVSRNVVPDDFRVESILFAIRRGKFKYYVRGGYCSRRMRRLTPAQVAMSHNLNVDDCLFEMFDPRIEAAVLSNPEMKIIGAKNKVEY